MAPFVECFKTATLGKSYRLKDVVSTWSNLLKHYISAEFLLMEGYVHGTLREELLIARFVE